MSSIISSKGSQTYIHGPNPVKTVLLWSWAKHGLFVFFFTFLNSLNKIEQNTPQILRQGLSAVYKA